MTIRDLYDKLISAARPFDFFGKLASINDLRKKFREFSKKVHPDGVYTAGDKYIASEAFQVLNRLFLEGQRELEEGTYGITDPAKLYEKQNPLFELKVKGKTCSFYENILEGEVAYIYRGICDGELVYLKLAIDKDDNGLIEKEYKILTENLHQLLPFAIAKIKVNGCAAILTREVKGKTADEFIKDYKNGIPAEHVMWMIERMLNVVGWLHSNKIVHGNIKPDNVIIDKDTHKVTLMGLAFSIPDANTNTAKYSIINDYYTAPEVNGTARVMPQSDIYSIGKIAVMLLGGNVKNNGMPVSIDKRVRDFVRRMCDDNISKRPSDAWLLWDELIKLRNEVYGTQRFQTLHLKID